MAKPFSYWSDKALSEKARKDAQRGVFDQPNGWVSKTVPGDNDYDRYKKFFQHHKQSQNTKSRY